jgi:hypothetical protein
MLLFPPEWVGQMRDNKGICVGLLGGIGITVLKKLTVEHDFQIYHLHFDVNYPLKSEFTKREIS